MRDRDVPQEGSATLDGRRKAVYAVAEDGKLRIVPSTVERRAEAARARVLAGETSPLEYHMYRARMDVTLLSQSTGLWGWRVRRHFRPRVFERLPRRLRLRYAEALGIALETLGKVD